MKEVALEQFEVGQKSLAEALYEVAFADGKASVEIPADIAEVYAKLEEAHKELVSTQEALAIAVSDDADDDAKIAQLEAMKVELSAKLEAIKAILVPQAPVVEAPIEEGTVGTIAEA